MKWHNTPHLKSLRRGIAMYPAPMALAFPGGAEMKFFGSVASKL